jgi:hypothetical protein
MIRGIRLAAEAELKDAHRREPKVAETQVGGSHMAKILGNHRPPTELPFDFRNSLNPAISPIVHFGRFGCAPEWTKCG